MRKYDDLGIQPVREMIGNAIYQYLKLCPHRNQRRKEQCLNCLIENGEVTYQYIASENRYRLGVYIPDRECLFLVPPDIEGNLLFLIKNEYPTLYSKLMEEGKESHRKIY
ncbi:hypothetical protein HZB88_04000 [archaeon]|nr:hypothetical protein [archaeon]